MNGMGKRAFIFWAFPFISFLLDACLISEIDIISKNSIQVAVDDKEAFNLNNTNCEVKVVTGSQCESQYGGHFFDDIVLLQNRSMTIWLNTSLDDNSNVTVCSRTAHVFPAEEFHKIHTRTDKDGVPPLFQECFFLQNGRRAMLYPFDSSWIHAYSIKDKISYSCTFAENFSEKRFKLCKLGSSCDVQPIGPGTNRTSMNLNNSAEQFEGTYFAVLENEYGKVQAPNVVWKMAFQNRDIQGVTLSQVEGDQVTMACNLQSSIPKVDPSHVSWTQLVNGLPTNSLHGNMVKSLDGSLVIFEASPDMNGTYTCEVRNNILGETMLDNPTTLIVSPNKMDSSPRSVKSLNIGHKDTIFAVTGKMAILQCLFRGSPEPRVFWYKSHSNTTIHGNGKFVFRDGNMTMYIFHVEMEDGGRYKCEASNGIGKAEYKIINLIVQEPPSFLENMESQNVTEGDDVTFHCTYKGEPKPTSRWYINGVLVDDDDDNDYIHISETPNDSKLKLLDIRDNSTSSVQCVASNPHGEIVSYAYMKVFKSTEIRTLITISNIDLSWAKVNMKFICNARTDPRTDMYIEWFVNETKISTDDSIESIPTNDNACTFVPFHDEFNITCLQLNSPMDVSCKASNGLSSESKKYRIEIDPINLASAGFPDFFEENSWLKYASFIFGGCVIVIVISAVTLAINRSCHKGKKAEISQSQMSVLRNQYRPSCSDAESSQGVSPHLKKDLINIISSLLIPRSSLELKKCIGNGHFGRVYMAALVHGRQISEIVAVKTMKYKAEESEMVELFLKEAVLMKDFQHQHVLGIRGITFAEDATPMVVLPYMANGDLRNYILNPELSITILNLLIMGMQVACGMDYLSKRHFVHRDLAARNCMVNENGVVKIADFGMSRQLISCDYYRVENGKDPVPIRWMAPECLEAKIFTTKSDVWAYGVLLWELMTRGAVPYPEAENWQVASLIQNDCLLKQPPFCPNVVYSMMTRCWNKESSSRPTFQQLLEEMEAVISVVPADVRRDSIRLPSTSTYSNVFSSN